MGHNIRYQVKSYFKMGYDVSKMKTKLQMLIFSLTIGPSSVLRLFASLDDFSFSLIDGDVDT